MPSYAISNVIKIYGDKFPFQNIQGDRKPGKTWKAWKNLEIDLFRAKTWEIGFWAKTNLEKPGNRHFSKSKIKSGKFYLNPTY